MPNPIRIPFPAYNGRRYGTPWIAHITRWPGGVKPVLSWGTYTGNTLGGVCEIVAEPSSLVRWGQKDNRRPEKSESHWGLVQDNGDIRELSPAEALAHWRSTHAEG